MRVKLTYFKERGKYYSEAEYLTSRTLLHEICAEIRVMRRVQAPMPGLIGAWTQGPIMVTMPGTEGVPHLILPENEHIEAIFSEAKP